MHMYLMKMCILAPRCVLGEFPRHSLLNVNQNTVLCLREGNQDRGTKIFWLEYRKFLRIKKFQDLEGILFTSFYFDILTNEKGVLEVSCAD